MYAQFLSCSFASPDSVMSYIASIKLWHILLELDVSPFYSVEFKLTKRGLERTMMHIPRPAAPITPQLLHKFHGFMDLTKPSDATYWALFLIAFFTMARKSNLVPDSISEFDHAKHLTRNRVIISEDCLLVFWSWAKNIQNHNRINKIPIVAIPGSILCPVKAFINMCKLVPAQSHQPAFLLCGRTGLAPVTYKQFNDKIKALITACGGNASLFSTHSFRRGGATFAFRAQVPDSLIAMQGDWASDCYKRYLDMNLADKSSVAFRVSKQIKAMDISWWS